MTDDHAITRLRGRTAIVTGARSGIGQAIAERFAKEGATVIAADIAHDAAGEPVSSNTVSINTVGGRIMPLRVDVTSNEDCAQMAQIALETTGRIDVVVANAGINGVGDAHTTDDEHWQLVLSVNLTGVWLTIKHALPAMMQARSGSIITMGSVGGLIGIPGILPYAAAKGGVISLTRQIAATYGEYGIRANSICPGTVRTPLVEKSRRDRGIIGDDDALDAAAGARTLIGRIGSTEDISGLAAYLASDESSWQTGTIIPLDGGRTAG